MFLRLSNDAANSKIRWQLLSLLVSFAVLSACLEAPETSRLIPITVQLSWLHQAEFSGLYAAQEQGYFKDAGLDVSFREVQEQERHALARELHDRVGQSLTALNLNLTIINDQLSNQNQKAPANTRLVDSIKLVSEMIAIVRDVMSDLRSVVLDEYGLVAAIQTYIGKFEKRYSIHVDFNRSHPIIPRVGAAMEMTVLRIVQEALLNIARHAQADHVSLSLQCEENAIVLKIEDNGIGLSSPENHSDGHGLMIMRERAEAVGGTLTISLSSGKGTRIEANLPFQQNSKIQASHEELK